MRVSKLKFTAEMFGMGHLNQLNNDECAEISQAIHDKYMASQVKVSGKYSGYGDPIEFQALAGNKPYNKRDTHTGILCDIQEIEKAEPECEHKPGPIDNRDGYESITIETMKCLKCGVEIKPTGWKLAEGDGE